MLAHVTNIPPQKLKEPSVTGNNGRYKTTIYPDGSYTVGYVKKKTIGEKERKYQEAIDRSHAFVLKQYRWHIERGYVEIKELMVDREQQARFINRSESSPPTSKREFRPGLTGHAKRMVRNAVHCMLQDRLGKLGFYTFTIPVLPLVSDTAVHVYFKQIVVRLIEKLKRRYERCNRGTEFQYVYVIESQSKRAASTGRPYWHLHLVCPCYKKGTKRFWCPAFRLRQMWAETLRDYTDGKLCDTSASIDSVVLRKNPNAYITKYLSKGCNPDIDYAAYGTFIKWGISSATRKTIHDNTLQGGDEMYQYLQYLRLTYGEHYRREIYIEIDGWEFKVGEAGALKMSVYNCKESLTARAGTS